MEIREAVQAVHVAPEEGGWIVRKTGADRVRSTFDAKDDALSFAKAVAAEHGGLNIIFHDGTGHAEQVDVAESAIVTIKRVNMRDSDQVKVTFVLPEDHPYGEDISVVGDFNDWQPGENPFVRRSNQTYSTNVTLKEGKRYAFRYFSEESGWVDEKEADDYVTNEYGGTNCVVET